MASGVYVIENMVNGKRYVGSAVSLRRRWNLHRVNLRGGSHHSLYLQNAWDKYGPDAFSFRVLFYCDHHNLLVFEQRALDIMRPEYNMCQTAGSRLGRKNTPESRAKLSAAMLGRKKSPEHCANLSTSHKGLTPWNKGRISEAGAGRPCSVETRAKIGAANRGRQHTAETRAKNGAAHMGLTPWNKGKTGIPLSPDHKAKISSALKGIPKSAETKANMSAAQQLIRAQRKVAV